MNRHATGVNDGDDFKPVATTFIVTIDDRSAGLIYDGPKGYAARLPGDSHDYSEPATGTFDRFVDALHAILKIENGGKVRIKVRISTDA